MKNQNNHKRIKLNQLKAKDKQRGFIKKPNQTGYKKYT